MKDFLKKHSYNFIRMFVNQFAIAIFGLVLAIAAGMSENQTLQIITSVGAIVFYLFLIYSTGWDIGIREHDPVEAGRAKFKPLTGLYISLVANAPNFILAVLITLSMLIENGILSKIGAFASMIAHFIQGMYTGVMTIKLNGEPLNSYWWIYFLIIVPALLVSTLSYFFGVKGWHLTNILIPETPEEAEKRREAKKKKKHKED